MSRRTAVSSCSLDEVVDVRGAVARARRAGAAGHERSVLIGKVPSSHARSGSVHRDAAPAPCRGARAGSARRSRRRRCPGRSPRRGRRARRSRAGASAHRAARWGRVMSRTPYISGLSSPSVPPIEIPSTPAADDGLRPTRAAGPRGPRPGRSRRPPGAPVRARVPVEAAVEPAVGSLDRAGGVLAVGVERRALVEDQGDVGARGPPGPPSTPPARGTARSRRCRSGSGPRARRSRGRRRSCPTGRACP